MKAWTPAGVIADMWLNSESSIFLNESIGLNMNGLLQSDAWIKKVS